MLIAANPLVEVGENLLGIDGLPVIAHRVPENRRKAQFARRSQDVGTAGSLRRTKVAHLRTESIFDGGVGSSELFANTGGGLEEQNGMGHRVVAHEVTRGMNAADQLNALADEAADDKEGGAHLVAGENLENRFGAEIVGTVIIGEGELPGIMSGKNG